MSFEGVAKLSPYFGYVIATMMSNHPFVPASVSKLFWRRQGDMRPSALSNNVSIFGKWQEIVLPLVMTFALPAESNLLRYSVYSMVLFHIFILSTVPAGVPLEWNISMIVGVLFQYYVPQNAALSVIDLWKSNSLLFIFVLFTSWIIPFIGHVKPSWVSFLVAMRYYAGNWNWGLMVFEFSFSKKGFHISLVLQRLRNILEAGSRE